MFSPSLDSFQEMAQRGNMIPVWAEIPADLDTPVSAFLKIRTGHHDFLLESVEGGANWGRYSFLGTKPRMIFRCRDSLVYIQEGRKKEIIEDNPLTVLRQILSRYSWVEQPDLPPFAGGFVGYMAYDMARSFEELPNTSKDRLDLDDAVFILTDTLIVFDNLKQVILVVVPVFIKDQSQIKILYKKAIEQIQKTIQTLAKPVPAKDLKSQKSSGKITLKASRTEKEFCSLVEKAKEYIAAGDIFQVQISMTFEVQTKADPFQLYRSIRRLTPTPYLYYLKLDDLTLVGASPELLVRLQGELVETRPIAGTRRRGRTLEEDRLMEEELKQDPKERAEHIMLVDLGRNDVGRVCALGSVKVDEQEVVEHYTHVMHLVSHVSGKLKKGCDALDVLQANFPAGTLTGAPKIRAMEIIEELEGMRRGTYGGCVGYIGFNGNMDMAITIRTALFRKGRVIVQAAGGIVYDSVPALEYKECHNKAAAMRRALESIQS